MKRGYYIIALGGILTLSLLTGCQSTVEKENVTSSSNFENSESKVMGKIVSTNDEGVTILSMERGTGGITDKKPSNGEKMAERGNSRLESTEPQLKASNDETKTLEGNNRNMNRENSIEKTINFSNNVEVTLTDGNIGSINDLKENDMISINTVDGLATKIVIQKFNPVDKIEK